MKVIGLCGGSGSGKGLVCDLLADMGIPSIDTDAIYHKITSNDSECLRELVKEFGEGILKGRALDRRRLSEIVFSSGQKLELLNKITHKHILTEVRKDIDKYREHGSVGVVVDAPALFESGFDKECDFTLCVCSSENLRIRRIMNRDSITEAMARKRIAAQRSDAWLRDNCDFFIDNNGTEAELQDRVSVIKRKIFDK